jgi:hypothetical protein
MKPPLRLLLLLGLGITLQPIAAQTVRAVPTYHNVGVHVEFPAASAFYRLRSADE